MRGLSWNLRIVLGLALLVILAAIVFFIYYTIVRLSHDGPIDIDAYQDASLVSEESLGEDHDHLQYVSNAPDASLETVIQHALDIENFYREHDYTCRTQYGEEDNGVPLPGSYVRSSCLLDHSSGLGFKQTVQMIIQPNRAPDDTLTGEVIIDINREWGNVGIMGN